MKKFQINWVILLYLLTSSASAAINLNDIKIALKWGESASEIAQRLLKFGENPLLISQSIAQVAPKSAPTVAALMAQAMPDSTIPNMAATTAQIVPSLAANIAVAVAEVVPQYVPLLVQIAEAVTKAVPSSKTVVNAALRDKIAAASAAEKHERQSMLAGNGAGIVAYVKGKAYLIMPNGNRQRLTVGTDLSNGATIVTGKGASVLVHNPDESSYVVNEKSRFKIKNYHFEESKPKKDKSIFYLAKGFLRFVSGIIAKRNPNKVEYQTPMMVAGVRGTEASLYYRPSDKYQYFYVSHGKLLVMSLSNQRRISIKSGIYAISPEGRMQKKIPLSMKKHFKAIKSMRDFSRKAAISAYSHMIAMNKQLMAGNKLPNKNQIKAFQNQISKLKVIVDKGTEYSSRKWGGIHYKISKDPLHNEAIYAYKPMMDYAHLVENGVQPQDAHHKMREFRKVPREAREAQGDSPPPRSEDGLAPPRSEDGLAPPRSEDGLPAPIPAGGGGCEVPSSPSTLSSFNCEQ